MVDVPIWDKGATNYVPVFGKDAVREALAQQDAQSREKEQGGEKKLRLREVDLNMATISRLTHMLTAYDSGTYQFTDMPRLRKSDVRNLQLLENVWHILYNPGGGIGYSPNIKPDTSMRGLAQLLGENPSPFQDSSERPQQQRLLQKLGLRIVNINQINGSVYTAHTHPSMRISYDRNPFQAMRMRSLLRAPKLAPAGAR